MNADAPVPFGWKRSARAGLTFRPAADDDRTFLTQVYASTHRQEYDAGPMTARQKAVLLLLRFRDQNAHFEKHHPRAERLIVTGGEWDIGRLYIERWPTQHAIIDLALLPEFRGKGAGAVVMRDLMDEAAAAGKPLSIQVQKCSPAIRLYLRLDFIKLADNGFHELMRWGESISEEP